MEMQMQLNLIFVLLLALVAWGMQSSCEGVTHHNLLSSNISAAPAPSLAPPKNLTKIGPTMSVSISNEEPGTITVHCSSKDDDLSLQTLAPGAMYGFQFQMNIWGTTLFSCEFQYGSQSAGFPVWKGPGFAGPIMCEQCLWVATPEGFYGGENGQTPTQFHFWNR